MVLVGVAIDKKLDIVNTLALKIRGNGGTIAGFTAVDENIAVIDLDENTVALANVNVVYIELGNSGRSRAGSAGGAGGAGGRLARGCAGGGLA